MRPTKNAHVIGYATALAILLAALFIWWMLGCGKVPADTRLAQIHKNVALGRMATEGVEGIYPYFYVSVYDHDGKYATIYADPEHTIPLANPFLWNGKSTLRQYGGYFGGFYVKEPKNCCFVGFEKGGSQ